MFLLLSYYPAILFNWNKSFIFGLQIVVRWTRFESDRLPFEPLYPNGQLGIGANWFWSSNERRRPSRIHMNIRIRDSRSFAPAVSHSGFMSAQQMFLGQVPRPVSFCRPLRQPSLSPAASISDLTSNLQWVECVCAQVPAYDVHSRILVSEYLRSDIRASSRYFYRFPAPFRNHLRCRWHRHSVSFKRLEIRLHMCAWKVPESGISNCAACRQFEVWIGWIRGEVRAWEQVQWPKDH